MSALYLRAHSRGVSMNEAVTIVKFANRVKNLRLVVFAKAQPITGIPTCEFQHHPLQENALPRR